jgi:iron(III) transport system ATP-binding protein
MAWSCALTLKVNALNTEYRSPNGTIVRAAKDVSFEVEEGTFFTLLGPSGCGKTTTLRSIAGLERPVGGEISVGGRSLYSSSKNILVEPHERNIGMVFQSYAIWPHMTVLANTTFPLEVRKGRLSASARREKAMRVLNMVGLDQFADRDATRLSGGQQQRLALARALVMEPALLLLDEPLSNLDAKLRDRMRFELKRIQREQGLTTVYVTHDQGEALAMSDDIAVMSDGRIVQRGSPRAIYDRPTSRFVADFIGNSNLIGATLSGPAKAGEAALFQTAAGPVLAVPTKDISKPGPAMLSIRPENISLAPDASGRPSSTIEGEIGQLVFIGDAIELEVFVNDLRLRVKTHPLTDISIGQKAVLHIAAANCTVLVED